MHSNQQSTFHVERLYLFIGNRHSAERLARRDNKEFIVVSIEAYKGNPSQRNNLMFKVLFADGDCKWRLFGKDIQTNEAFISFCQNVKECRYLVHSSAEQARLIKAEKDDIPFKRDDRILVNL